MRACKPLEKRMGNKFIVAILLLMLAGCDLQPADERLEMDLKTIRSLCMTVADSKAIDAPRDYRAEKAECELEYRIKQQEANKRF